MQQSPVQVVGHRPLLAKAQVTCNDFWKNSITWEIHLQFKTSLPGFNNNCTPLSFIEIVLLLPAVVTIYHSISPTAKINNILLPRRYNTSHFYFFSILTLC